MSYHQVFTIIEYVFTNLLHTTYFWWRFVQITIPNLRTTDGTEGEVTQLRVTPFLDEGTEGRT